MSDEKPIRPPDKSVRIDVLSDQAIKQLREIARRDTPLSAGEQAALLQRLSGMVATLSETLESVLRLLPAIATGKHDFATLEPEIEDDGAER